ncbi:MAG: endolytic transglycosylase MltG [Alphaproteobacteria bacterium]|nr:endolytic transglycosylase MltG [Alphaproteobacteria bacterium]
MALVFSLASGLALAAAAGVLLAAKLLDAPGPHTAEVTLVLPKGAGIADLGRRLAAAQVVADPLMFRAGAIMLGVARRLQAGEYRFPPRSSLRQVLARIAAGDTLVRRLVVPEGLTTRAVLALLAAAEALEGSVPEGLSEGVLLPEIYHYHHGDQRAVLLQRMRAAQEQALDALWQIRRPGLPFAAPAEALVLASIVEKETALPEERRRIAAVFVNRLLRGMRLQADSTVVYAVTAGQSELDRPLSRADLRLASPYNTYLIDGLPPTPIANPGRAVIAAVLDPLVTDELYFVADGTGGHAFARTLRAHDANVAAARRQQPHPPTPATAPPNAAESP